MLSACCACLVLGVDDRVTCLLMAQSRLERFCVKKPDQRLCLSRLSGLSLKGLVLLCAISRWRVLRCVVRAQIFSVRRPIHHFGVSFSRPGRASLRKRRRSVTMGSVVCCGAYAGSVALFLFADTKSPGAVLCQKAGPKAVPFPLVGSFFERAGFALRNFAVARFALCRAGADLLCPPADSPLRR